MSAALTTGMTTAPSASRMARRTIAADSLGTSRLLIAGPGMGSTSLLRRCTGDATRLGLTAVTAGPATIFRSFADMQGHIYRAVGGAAPASLFLAFDRPSFVFTDDDHEQFNRWVDRNRPKIVLAQRSVPLELTRAAAIGRWRLTYLTPLLPDEATALLREYAVVNDRPGFAGWLDSPTGSQRVTELSRAVGGRLDVWDAIASSDKVETLRAGIDQLIEVALAVGRFENELAAHLLDPDGTDTLAKIDPLFATFRALRSAAA